MWDFRSTGGAHLADCSKVHIAFLWIDDAEVLDDLEMAVACTGDVHVHANVMLTRHHFGRAARSLGNLCVVERLDDIVLPERACLAHGRLPELQTPVWTR